MTNKIRVKCHVPESNWSEGHLVFVLKAPYRVKRWRMVYKVDGVRIYVERLKNTGGNKRAGK